MLKVMTLKVGHVPCAILSQFTITVIKVHKTPVAGKSRTYHYEWVEFVIPLLVTTSRKRPPAMSDHFLNNRFVSQSNTVSKTLS